MSGDWIKMRVGLTTSPRVMRIAECLLEDGKYLDWSGLSFGMQGYPPPKESETRAERHSALRVTRYVTVTALLKFWGYANEHVKGEVIAGIYPEDIDEIVGVPGFAEAIESAGWVVFDAQGGLTMPNFAEHNTSAGERSSGAIRQKRYRENLKVAVTDSDVVSDVTRDVTVTRREEKRREEKKEQEQEATHSAKAPHAIGSRLPADWQPSPDELRWARDARPDLAVTAEIESFRDYWIAKPGKDGRKSDWAATWRNWIRRANASRGGSPQSTVASGNSVAASRPMT